MKKLLVAGAVSLFAFSGALAQDSDSITLTGTVTETLDVEAAAYSVNLSSSEFVSPIADVTVTTNTPGNIDIEIESTNGFQLVPGNTSAPSLGYGIRLVEGNGINSCPCLIDVNNPGGTTVTTGSFNPSNDYVTGQLLTLGLRRPDSTMLAGTYTDDLTITVSSL